MNFFRLFCLSFILNAAFVILHTYTNTVSFSGDLLAVTLRNCPRFGLRDMAL